MSIQTIYARLRQLGMTAVGACGLMGNMRDESAMRANNAQDSYGRNDESYTAGVNAGNIGFVNDSIGYGLCQWTAPDRKAKLLAYARGLGVSIDNEDMQTAFAVKEMKEDFPGVWQALQTTNSVYEAARIVCLKYERPANAESKVAARAGFANEFYMSLGGMDVSQPSSPDNSPTGEPGDEIFHTPAVGNTSSTASGPPSPQREGYWPPRVLAYRMAGPDVVALQGLLIAHDFPAGITGQFDQTTDGQVRAFQRAKGLKADGIAGAKTWAALVKGV